MRRYKTKPEFVKAMQLTPDTAKELERLTGGQITYSFDAENRSYVELNIPTIVGVIRASEGQMLVHDAYGHWNIMMERDFQDKYELA